MSSKIPNLWPTAAVSFETLSPVAILRVQAENLTRMTHGLLQGEVTTTNVSQKTVRHHFSIAAPALNGYRHEILRVKHDKGLVYPVSFVTDELTEDDELHVSSSTAYTEAEFIELLTGALQSGYVLSVINSLIARSNEARPEGEPLEARELQPA